MINTIYFQLKIVNKEIYWGCTQINAKDRRIFLNDIGLCFMTRAFWFWKNFIEVAF